MGKKVGKRRKAKERDKERKPQDKGQPPVCLAGLGPAQRGSGPAEQPVDV